MAKRVFSAYGITPAGTADANAIPANQYMALFGGSGTQRTDVLEVKITGMQATTPSPTALVMGRCSPIHTGTPTALSTPNADGPMDPATAALAAPVTPFIAAATTNPQRSASDAKLDMGLNVFGGLFRWNATPTQQWIMIGNTAPFGECVLSALNIGTPSTFSAHIIYETY